MGTVGSRVRQRTGRTGPSRWARTAFAATALGGLLAGVETTIPGAGATAAAAAAIPAPTAATLATPTNGSWAPVYNRDFPDPSILAYQGTYYAYSTEVVKTAIPAAHSTDAVSWHTIPGGAVPELPPWAVRGGTWAPTVAQAPTGQFVMYYTAKDVAYNTECIGRATSSSPAGPFVDNSFLPVVCDPQQGGDIDPDIFTDTDGHSYLIVKNDGNHIGSTSTLWSRPLDDNLAIAGGPTALLTSDQGWQAGVVEAPDMVKVDGTYYLFYGGGSYLGFGYAIGFATCDGPNGPCLDAPQNPVLATQPGLVGPGGPSVFVGPSGQLLMGFAAWRDNVVYPQGYRPLYMASLSFAGGVPQFAPANPVLPAGYWEVASDGGVFSFGLPFYGSTGGLQLNQPVVGAAATPDGGGYWFVARDGGVFAFGDAGFYGSMGGQPLNQPIVGMAPTIDGGGYWLVAKDGGIFAFGDAGFYGSMGGQPLNQPVVGMAADPDSDGYWEVAADGGVFSFNAAFQGSAGGSGVNDIVGMTAAPNGDGYWFATASGRVFAEGKGAPNFGSMAGTPLAQPVVGIASTPDGDGYRLVARDGGIFSFGDAPFFGSMGGQPLNQPIIGLAVGPG